MKDLEVGLYDCLASTFRQTYPRKKLTTYLCVASADDPAYPLIRQVVSDFPEHDARIFVEEHDPLLHGPGGSADHLGPNPKIRNISRAYREAKGDIIWVIDCNVWVSKGVAGRMVDKLVGLGPDGEKTTPYKFVHQLPLVADITPSGADSLNTLGRGGGRLEEMFMATTHAKFYGAINTVGIAPCILGKSNMFRKSHLDTLTDPSRNPILSAADASRGRGIDFFSSYICEDHLIGDLLWRSRLPGFANHGLVAGDPALQPMAGMSVPAYVGRRVRWLRVRKYTVTVATLVEPGVESLLCCAYLAFAVTTIPWFHAALGVPQTWLAMVGVWLIGVTTWMLVDRWLFCKLQKCQSVEVDENTPFFARGAGRNGGTPQRPFPEWFMAWIGREVLALPVWTWAVLLGATVRWRGKSFKVRMDMSVVEVGAKKARRAVGSGEPTPGSKSKDWVD